MSVVPLPFPTAKFSADRTIRAAGALVPAYLAATLWPMMRYTRATQDTAPLIAHVVALVIALAVVLSRGERFRPLRDWLPLVLGPFLYIELRWLIAGVGRPHADALIVAWEHSVFGGSPSSTLAPALPFVALSETLHFAYASYYLLIYLPPLILYARGRRVAFSATLLALTITYGVCFTTFLFFPVDGPRFLIGPAAAPAGPVRTFVVQLLAAGSSRGTAFPSSHVAASVVASLCALRYQRRIGIAVAALTVGLALGAVYGGFHYGVDVLAGLAVGLACWLAAGVVRRALSPEGVQSATAA